MSFAAELANLMAAARPNVSYVYYRGALWVLYKDCLNCGEEEEYPLATDNMKRICAKRKKRTLAFDLHCHILLYHLKKKKKNSPKVCTIVLMVKIYVEKYDVSILYAICFIYFVSRSKAE